jgi:peptidoglycan/LPS O-acetylase OafA/YrhL
MIGLIVGTVKYSINIRPAIALGLLVIALVLSRFFINQDTTQFEITIMYYFVAFSFGTLVFSMRSKNINLLNRMKNINSFLASFSFSLYLIHFPLMLFILALVESLGLFPLIAFGYQPNNLNGLLLYVFVIVTIYLLSYIFSLITEKKTHIVRSWLKKYFL